MLTEQTTTDYTTALKYNMESHFSRKMSLTSSPTKNSGWFDVFVHLAPELWSKIAGRICLLYDLAWNVIKANAVDRYFTSHFLCMKEQRNIPPEPSPQRTILDLNFLRYSEFRSSHNSTIRICFIKGIHACPLRHSITPNGFINEQFNKMLRMSYLIRWHWYASRAIWHLFGPYCLVHHFQAILSLLSTFRFLNKTHKYAV